MTEPRDDDRAEQAFRDALREHAEEPQFEPLELPAAPHAARGRLPRWLPVAAAVVLVAAVAIPLALSQFQGGSRNFAVPANAPERVPGDAATGTPRPVASARPGWRWESYRVLSYQVPQYWAYGYAPVSDWCTGRTQREAAPFVDLAPGKRIVAQILCPRDIPAERMQTFVSVRAVGAPDRGWDLPAGWKTATKELNGYLVEVVYTDELATVAEQIVASVRPMGDVDPNGCAATSTLTVGSGPAAPADQDPPERVSLCQYDLDVAPAQLLASKLLTGTDGHEVAGALAAAPAGSGPDDPSCTSAGNTAALARLWRGTVAADVVVRYSGCRGNGIVDGAGSRQLTEDACQQVLQTPLVFTAGHGEAAKLCAQPPPEVAGPQPSAVPPSAKPTASPTR